MAGLQAVAPICQLGVMWHACVIGQTLNMGFPWTEGRGKMVSKVNWSQCSMSEGKGAKHSLENMLVKEGMPRSFYVLQLVFRGTNPLASPQ